VADVIADLGRPAPGAHGTMLPVRYRVTRNHRETQDTVTLDLEPIDDPIAEPGPGQFTMLYSFPAGEAPISVSGNPGDEGVLRHTIRAAGIVTSALCAAEPGTTVGVRGPFGRGWDLGAARGKDVVVVGGGIGLAPLRTLVRQVLAARADFGRVSVLVGARTPDDLVLRDEVEHWRGRLDVEVAVTVDAADPSWRGDVGLVTKLLDRAPFAPDHVAAFVCGPEVMMRFVALGLMERGVPPEAVEVSLERNMQCAIRRCGHCLLGPMFVCTDGPVLPWSTVAPLLAVRRW
jgi:NAD(P)H-flavin reductase